jgi:DNA-3-methyladenine glycosylase II
MIQETFWLDPLPPFRLDLTVWALRRKARNLIDQWDGTCYTRVLLLDGQPVKVTVSQPHAGKDARLLATATSRTPLTHLSARISNVLERVLGYTTDVSAFARLASRDQWIAPLAQQFLGLKPPRFPTLFEAALNAFACQQVSLDVGILLLNRLTEHYGLKWSDEQNALVAFPGPEQLVTVSEEQLRALGWTYHKARAVLELARLLVEQPSFLSSLESQSDGAICQTLLPLRGIGRWSAEYMLLRGFGRIDMFPGDDVGARNKLQALLGRSEQFSYAQIKEITSHWHPYAGFVYFHLLLGQLERQGLLREKEGRGIDVL